MADYKSKVKGSFSELFKTLMVAGSIAIIFRSIFLNHLTFRLDQ